RGRYSEEIERAKKFILATQTEKGLFVSPAPSHGPMYEHALATLACAELYGMDPDPTLDARLRSAVNLIVSAQNPNGGWRYEPAPGDHDLSVTAMQIIALRAAQNAEIPVPELTFRRAIDYVRSCAHHTGGFGYLPGGAPNPQMSAAGTLSLQLLGVYDDEHVARTLDEFAKLPVEWRGGEVTYFYYFHYYAAQVHYQAGGKHWNEWRPKIRTLLIDHQNTDGSWDVPPNTAEVVETVGPRKIYWTAMASLVLEVYMHYLPAYQR
ncbi:MAG TPA: prenyltransferase/squalene oxidase repeat-containing protein, partial [Pirellulales bacterium]